MTDNLEITQTSWQVELAQSGLEDLMTQTWDCITSTTVTTDVIDFEPGVNTVTFEVTDAAGSTATCNVTVTVAGSGTDTPTISCPEPIDRCITSDEVCTVSLSLTASMTDNCEISVTSYQVELAQSGPQAISSTTQGGITSTSVTTDEINFEVGINTLTFALTDAAGNTTECAVNITVNDCHSPTVTCPRVPPLCTENAQVCTASLSLTAEMSDNCEISVTSYQVELAQSGPQAISSTTQGGITSTSVTTDEISFEVGVNTLTFALTDAADNTTECSVNITVNDCHSPTISCPRVPSLCTDNAQVCTAALSLTASMTDNCEISVTSYQVELAQSGPQAISSTTQGGITSTSVTTDAIDFEVGVNTLTFALTDAAGNTTECAVNITVNDCHSPTISCPATPAALCTDNAQVCTAALSLTASMTDNCEISVTSYQVELAQSGLQAISSTTQGGITSTSVTTDEINFEVGVNTLTFALTDAAGNTTECAVNVTVRDCHSPTVSCPRAPPLCTDNGQVCTAA